MDTFDEKRWERMRQVLTAEWSGDKPVRISSRRTLFGIPSHVEEVIARTAAEIEEENKAALRAKREAESTDEGAREDNPVG